MNKIKGAIFFLILAVIFLFSGQTAHGQKFSTAVDYLDFMNEEYSRIARHMWEYTKAVAHGKRARRVEKERQTLINTTLQARKKIGNMPDFQGNVDFRDSVAAYLDISYVLLTEDYAQILDMEEIAEQSYDLMEAYLLAKKKASEKLVQAGQMMNNAKERFARRFGIQLVKSEDKISKNLKVSGEVNEYYNDLFLIFFKSSKQEIYLTEALNRNDVNALEQNKNTMLEYTREGLDKLNRIKAFNGDGSLRTACKEMLLFLQREAGEKVPLMTGFFLEMERFQDIRTAFEGKRKSEVSQEDIDQYNESVRLYNEAVQNFNAMNVRLNKDRTRLLDRWNDAVERFLDKHVP